jgi:hypothetical protein
MADIRKMVDDLAAAAKVGAKGQKMACGCSTCQEAVDEAERIVLRLFEEKCETFALAVAIIAYGRLSHVFGEIMGEARLDRFEDRLERDCNAIGMRPTALMNAMDESRRTRVKPKVGPV